MDEIIPVDLFISFNKASKCSHSSPSQITTLTSYYSIFVGLGLTKTKFQHCSVNNAGTVG
jgi:hypothetical protein